MEPKFKLHQTIFRGYSHGKIIEIFETTPPSYRIHWSLYPLGTQIETLSEAEIEKLIKNN